MPPHDTAADSLEAWKQAVLTSTPNLVAGRLDALMAGSVDVTAQRQGLRAAFEAAGVRNDLDVARCVLDRVFTDTLFPRQSPLVLAAERGHVALTLALLNRGLRSPEALQTAIERRQWAIVDVLLTVAGGEASRASVWAALPMARAPMDLVVRLAQRDAGPSEQAMEDFIEQAVGLDHAAPLLAWALAQPQAQGLPLSSFLEQALRATNLEAIQILAPKVNPTATVPALGLQARAILDRALMTLPEAERARWLGAIQPTQFPLLDGWARSRDRLNQAPNVTAARTRAIRRS